MNSFYLYLKINYKSQVFFFFCITEYKRPQNVALSGFFCQLFVKKGAEFDPKWQPVWVLISHQRLKTGC